MQEAEHSTMRVLLLLFLLLSCRSPSDSQAEIPRPAEEPWLKLNGRELSRADFLRQLELEQGPEFLNAWLDRLLVEKAAQEAELKLSPEQLKAALLKREAEAMRAAGGEAAFLKQLQRCDINLESWRAGQHPQARHQLLKEALIRASGRADRLKHLFKERYSGGHLREVRQILIRFPKELPPLKERVEQIRAARRQAEALRHQLLRGRSWQDAESLISGSGRFGQSFEEAIEQLSLGEIGALIRSSAGFHLLKVERLRRGAEYEGRWILLEGSKARSQGEQLQKRLKRGEEFEILARAHSKDPLSRAQGGALGRFSPGRLGPDLDPLLESLPLKTPQLVDLPTGAALIQLSVRRFLPRQDRKLLRHFLIPFPVDLSAQEALREQKTRERAEILMLQLQEGEEFSILALQSSEDRESAERGGRLEKIPSPLKEALEQMKEGELRLLRSGQGWHILKLERALDSSFEALSPQLKLELQKEPISEREQARWMAQLRAQAQIMR